MYIIDHAHLKDHHVAKYRGTTPTTAKVIGVYLLKFKPILDTPLKKIVRGTHVPTAPVGGALARLGYSLAHANIWECSTS